MPATATNAIACRRPGAQRLDRLADRQHVARPGERKRAGSAGCGRAPSASNRASYETGGPSSVSSSRASGADGRHGVRDPAHPAIARDLLPGVARRRIAAERLGDRQRAVGEVARGREHADPNAVSGERLERQQPFERADASARDHDVFGMRERRARRPPRIGDDAPAEQWKPAASAWRSPDAAAARPRKHDGRRIRFLLLWSLTCPSPSSSASIRNAETSRHSTSPQPSRASPARR